MFNIFKKHDGSKLQKLLETIDTISEFESLLNTSHERPVFFLKHSTRCPVSDWALTEFSLAARKNGQEARFVWLDLIAHRDVSDAVAKMTGVAHQSPQLFWIEKGVIRGTVTHEEVKATRISEWLGLAV
jgi:bacillithiol system protein YtxJ